MIFIARLLYYIEVVLLPEVLSLLYDAPSAIAKTP